MPEPDAGGEAAHRLPRTAVPHRYELTVEPDLEAASFAGFVSIGVAVAEQVEEIVLNAAELDIEEAWVEGSERIDAVAELDGDTERLTLTLARPVEPGDATVHVRFRGVLNDKLRGFYRSLFTDESGRQHTIATTQMEPTDARRAFPCWDEPDLKAVFTVTLVVPEGMVAISNARSTSETPTGDGHVEVRFADTIPMSTYLVAMVVGPLEVTEAVDVDGVALRVVHVPGKGHLAPYALDVGAFCLRWFSEWYGIPYPGDKCDLIALPDFAAGAMENLGAITFREAVLLVDPDAVTQLELQRVADVVAHELAHMWFGDLVTMRWWNGLWLNEAFATLMELMAVDAYRPVWHRWDSFTLERAGAFAVDALESTRPVEYPVASPEEAEGMFDVLTYQKGASVLRMLERYLGAESFREGIRLYLRSRAYGNAETTDLWDAIEEASGEPVRRIMDSWIFQGGHPVVSVEAEGDTLHLAQRRFRYATSVEAAQDGETSADADPGPQWSVPMLVAPIGSEALPVLLEGPSNSIDLPGAGKGVVANAGGHGFYRVRYSPALLASLGEHLFDLKPVERALLVEDTWAAVLAGATTSPDFLELARRFTAETDRAVWGTLLAALGSLEHVVDDDTLPSFQDFVRGLLGPAVERLGWRPTEGDDDLTRQLRGALLAALGGLGADWETRRRAREVHQQHVDRPGEVDPNVAAATVAIIARSGTADDHDALLDRYRTTSSPQEQLRYLYSLGDIPDPELARQTLGLTLTDAVRSQNGPFLVQRLLTNRSAKEVAWAFIKDEWQALNERFPDSAIPRLLGGVTALSRPDLAADVEAFLARHPVPQGARTVEQHLERLRVNAALREREATRLAEHLR